MSNDFVGIAALASALTRNTVLDGVRPGWIGRKAVEVQRDADALRRLAEKECNGEMTERDERRQKRLEERVSATLKEFGAVEVQFNGDPRGAAVKIKFKGGESYDDWGGEGLWCL